MSEEIKAMKVMKQEIVLLVECMELMEKKVSAVEALNNDSIACVTELADIVKKIVKRLEAVEKAVECGL